MQQFLNFLFSNQLWFNFNFSLVSYDKSFSVNRISVNRNIMDIYIQSSQRTFVKCITFALEYQQVWINSFNSSTFLNYLSSQFSLHAHKWLMSPMSFTHEGWCIRIFFLSHHLYDSVFEKSIPIDFCRYA